MSIHYGSFENVAFSTTRCASNKRKRTTVYIIILRKAYMDCFGMIGYV